MGSGSQIADLFSSFMQAYTQAKDRKTSQAMQGVSLYRQLYPDQPIEDPKVLGSIDAALRKLGLGGLPAGTQGQGSPAGQGLSPGGVGATMSQEVPSLQKAQGMGPGVGGPSMVGQGVTRGASPSPGGGLASGLTGGVSKLVQSLFPQSQAAPGRFAPIPPARRAKPLYKMGASGLEKVGDLPPDAELYKDPTADDLLRYQQQLDLEDRRERRQFQIEDLRDKRQRDLEDLRQKKMDERQQNELGYNREKDQRTAQGGLKVGGTKEGLVAKVARGEELTEAEQRALDMISGEERKMTEQAIRILQGDPSFAGDDPAKQETKAKQVFDTLRKVFKPRRRGSKSSAKPASIGDVLDDASSLPDGTVVEGDDGKTYIIQGGKPVLR